MLTSEHTDTSQRATAADEDPGRPHDGQRAPQRLRLAAIVLGLLGALLAAAVPLLPVVQDTAVISWPDGGDTTPVNAPLAAYQAQQLSATVPCTAVSALDARSGEPASVLSTVPPGSADGAAVGMVLQVEDGALTVTSRGQVLGTAPVPPGPCDVQVSSAATGTTVMLGDRRMVNVTEDVRPQVIGIYTDLDEALDPVDGLGVQISPDTRFQSVPHPLKIAATGLAVLAVLAALVLLHRLDLRVGRRAPRLLPPGWWRPTGRDVTVIAVLAVWVVIGGITSDDGYILTMIQSSPDAGYIGNYYRWFNVAEAPFGWTYELYAAWAQWSTAPPWLRIPSFVMGVVSWLLISREVLPRLGREVRRSAAAGWAAAAVFLAFWLPYNNGLRLEPVVAIGSLLALCAVERAVALRRVLPLALGVLAAAFTVAATPTGFIAVAPFLVAIRPILRLLRQHAAASGWAAVLAPIVGAGLLVLVVIFADQTLEAVLEATRVRTAIGPTLSWFEEPTRYLALFTPSPDGSLPRRFPVLLLLLCVGTCLVVLLRRSGIPGASLAPSRRLIGTAALSLVLIALTPTKWTHHFGSFASIGAALGALTALATSSTVLRSARNRWWFLAGLLFILALASTGPNAPWYVSQFGVPWFDKPPSLGGVAASTVLIATAGVAALVAVVENLRHEPGAPPPPQPDRADRRRRALRIGSAPLSVICALLVLAEFAAMGKAIHKQRDSYSLGAANIAHIFDASCNLSDAVMVERTRVDGALPPSLPVTGFENFPRQNGFVRDRLPVATPDEPEQSTGDQKSVKGDRVGEDGSEEENPVDVPPPGIGGQRIPVWSSYDPDGPGTGQARTSWFVLPPAAAEGRAPVTVAVAGVLRPGTPITAEFGKRRGDRIEVVDEIPIRGGATDDEPGWRDYRVNAAAGPASGADTVRLVAADADVTGEGWIAFSAPRVPVLTPMTDFVGRDTPVFMDWPVGFVHPCLQPSAIRNGVVEVPEYRLLPDERLMFGSEVWSAATAGGPLGWLELLATERELPTYLEGAWDTDWGKLTIVEPLVAESEQPTVRTGTAVRSGWWTPGPLHSGGESSAVSPLTR
ncbi:MAG: arabinosyltransferase domain-containing protein [Pseudonocardiaceae bacterium]